MCNGDKDLLFPLATGIVVFALDNHQKFLDYYYRYRKVIFLGS